MTISYILMFLLIIILILIICSIIVNSIQNTYDQPIKKLGGVYKNGKLGKIYKGGTIEQLMIDINTIIAEWPTLDIDTIKEKIKEKIQRAIELEKALCEEEKNEQREAYAEVLMQKNEEVATVEYNANIHFQRLMSDYLPILYMIETDILKKNENNQYDKELIKVSELISNIKQNYYAYLDNENKELSNYIQMWVAGISDKLANSDKLQQANDDLLQVIQVQNKMIEAQKQIIGKLQKISTTDNHMKLLDNALSKEEELHQLSQLLYINMEDINKIKDTHIDRDVKQLDIALAEQAMQQSVELAKGMKDIEDMKEEYERIIQENSNIIHKANEDIESYLQIIENLSKKHIQLGEDNTKLSQIINEIGSNLSTVERDGEKFKVDVIRSAMGAYSEQDDKIHHLEDLIQKIDIEIDSANQIIQDIAHIVGTDYDSQNILDKIKSIVIANLTLQNELSDKINQNEKLSYNNRQQERSILAKNNEIADQYSTMVEQDEEINKQNTQNRTLLEELDKRNHLMESMKDKFNKELKFILRIHKRERNQLSKINNQLNKINRNLEKEQVKIISENKEFSSNLYIILAKMEKMKEWYSLEISTLNDKLSETSSKLLQSSEELIAAKTQIQENEREITDYKQALLGERKSVSILEELYNAVTKKLDSFSDNSSRQISKLSKMTKKLFTRISIL
jgi:hypothetical protein